MLYIWETTSLQLVYALAEHLPGAVRSLDFSGCGSKLVVVCDVQDGGSSVGVFDLHQGVWEFTTRREERCYRAWYDHILLWESNWALISIFC